MFLCRRLCAGNGGVMPPAWPGIADAPAAPADDAQCWDQVSDHFGGWAGGVRAGFIGVQKRFSSWPRLSQSLRRTTHSPALIAPCLAPCLHMVDGQQEIRVGAAFWRQIQHVDGCHRRCTGRVGIAVGIILPVIQWCGASKWVPECSPTFSQFHAQNGPSASYSEMR